MSAALGVAAAVCSGLANGSWNLPTKPDAPRSVYAGTVWAWENIWFVANVLIPIFNTALVLAVVGPSVLSEVFAEAEPRHLWAICVPSLAWGWGGVGFGQAIKRLGVALGTSIVMGIIVVIGTALPAILDADELTATQASGVALGVALGVAGFVAGGRAGLLRDRALEKEKQTHVDVEVVDHARSDDVVANAGLGGVKDARDAKLRESPSDSGSSSDSFWVSILWCLAGGVLSSMLQFAFVFGGAVVDLAKNKGVPDAAAAMPVWLLCFACNAFGHLAYSGYLLRVNGTWRRFFVVSTDDVYKRESDVAFHAGPPKKIKNSWGLTLHAVFMCALMALAMPFHIHTYGIAAVLLGRTGAVFAWPVVMSATVFTAQSWSLVLREFEGAPKIAKRWNTGSLCLLVSSVVVVAVTGTFG
jgi:L-rhamnose-H+ transport protein